MAKVQKKSDSLPRSASKTGAAAKSKPAPKASAGKSAAGKSATAKKPVEKKPAAGTAGKTGAAASGKSVARPESQAAKAEAGKPADVLRRPAGRIEPLPVKIDVRIEETDNGFFNIVVGRVAVFFNLEEMRALTRISHASPDADEGAERLHRWMERERKDFLNDVGISRPRHPALKGLWNRIVTTYKVRGG